MSPSPPTISNFHFESRGTFLDLIWSTWLRLAPAGVRIFCYKLLRRVSLVFMESKTPRVAPLLFGLYSKHGAGVRVEEALATQFVFNKTSIPVPRILDVVQDEKGVFILSTALPGTPIVYVGGLDHPVRPERSSIFIEVMRSWFEQLRSLSPPDPDQVTGFAGTPLWSDRIAHDHSVGPFNNMQEFHDYFYRRIPPKHHSELRDLEKKCRKQTYRLCFTHGDINPTNILVNPETGRPTGIIDWECAGWLPEYWDYTKSIYMRRNQWEWHTAFGRIFPGYEQEIALERAIWAVHFPW